MGGVRSPVGLSLTLNHQIQSLTQKSHLSQLCRRKGFSQVAPPPALCTDNGAMIAWAGVERLRLGLTDGLDIAARARWPLDPQAPPAIGAGVKA